LVSADEAREIFGARLPISIRLLHLLLIPSIHQLDIPPLEFFAFVADGIYLPRRCLVLFRFAFVLGRQQITIDEVMNQLTLKSPWCFGTPFFHTLLVFLSFPSLHWLHSQRSLNFSYHRIGKYIGISGPDHLPGASQPEPLQSFHSRSRDSLTMPGVKTGQAGWSTSRRLHRTISHEPSESPKRALALDLVRRGIVGGPGRFLVLGLEFDVLRAACNDKSVSQSKSIKMRFTR
jgi:hypothetical protein